VEGGRWRQEEKQKEGGKEGQVIIWSNYQKDVYNVQSLRSFGHAREDLANRDVLHLDCLLFNLLKCCGG